ncbi:MAG: hypothetical protein ACRC2T_10375 [Thermoguttaceae bacterium]
MVEEEMKNPVPERRRLVLASRQRKLAGLLAKNVTKNKNTVGVLTFLMFVLLP